MRCCPLLRVKSRNIVKCYMPYTLIVLYAWVQHYWNALKCRHVWYMLIAAWFINWLHWFIETMCYFLQRLTLLAFWIIFALINLWRILFKTLSFFKPSFKALQKKQYGTPSVEYIVLSVQVNFHHSLLRCCSKWGTTSVYFGITYVWFVPSRLPVFTVEPQYQYHFLFLSKVSFEGHKQNLQKNSCRFTTWMGFVGQILFGNFFHFRFPLVACLM